MNVLYKVECVSYRCKLDVGVPEGSIIGLHLFLFYINDNENFNIPSFLITNAVDTSAIALENLVEVLTEKWSIIVIFVRKHPVIGRQFKGVQVVTAENSSDRKCNQQRQL